ncbi:MAG: amidase [Beijerinckiaceae bacterium]|nr:amidase [Beijerinckiaceae bacterium]
MGRQAGRGIDDTVGAFVPGGQFVIEGSPDGPLAGLTFAAKDLFDIAGRPTGAGNPTWLETHAAPERTSPIVETLLAAGATLVGKVITDEMAFSLQGDNMHYGAPVNAGAPDRVTGGSSSGSVAAAAARLVDFALGTDTGGSTRVPASYCGVWGLRPTHDLLSSQGIVPLHPAYDTPTWFAHDADTFVKVAEVLLPDAHYGPSAILRLDDARALADDVFEPPIQRVLEALTGMLGSAPRPVTMGDEAGLHDWRVAYATSGAFEGWAIHGDWITRCKPVFAPAIAARWRAASEVTAEAAAQARAQTQRIRARVRSIVSDNCVAVLPSAASLAPLRDADPATIDAIRLRTMAMTCIAGISGLPQVSMPFRTPDGTPVGISLMGPAGSDLQLVRLAVAVHRAAQTA